MKFSFKKIGSVLASTAMLSSTVALAAAANFPAPFVKGGAADVAIVYGGADAAYTDIVAAADITSVLSTKLAEQTTTNSGVNPTTEGETSPLFSSGTKLYINDSLKTVKSVLTKSDLPTILKDDSFSGNVDATYTQTIDLGSNPSATFAKQPTSSDDPSFALTLSTTSTNIIYNASVSFNKAVNFTHANTKGQSLQMFGQTFTVGSATDSTNLVLLKSAEKLSLTNDDPSKEVTIGGKTYTVELVSASATTATIKVTDSTGASATKEITEAQSKKVNGLTIAVDTADSNNFALTASIIAGAEKVTITSGSAVTIGEDDTVIDGTTAYLIGGTNELTKLAISVVSPDSDKDAIKPGEEFIDPVFGSFKLNFAGLSIPDDSTTAREDIKITNNGDDKMELTMTDSRANTKIIQWAKNNTVGLMLQVDDNGRNITVFERASAYKNDYVIVGNEDEGRLLKVSTITNQTSGYSSDKVKFTDVFSGTDNYEATLDAEGHGTVTVAGKVYDVNYFGAQSVGEESRYVRVNYPDSAGATSAIVYPTIQTSKGALVAFYKPVTLDYGNWDGGTKTLATLRFPDGDGFTDVTLSSNEAIGGGSLNITFGSTVTNVNTSAAAGSQSASGSIGRLTYNLTSSATANQTTLYLVNPQGGNIVDPALVIFEEKDDNTNYEALIVTLEQGGTSDDGMGVNDVVRTWSADNTWDNIALASDSKKAKDADLFGTIILTDSSDSDQKTAVISYPDEQVEVQMYMGAISSAVTGASTGGSSKALGSVVVADTEASSVAGKNLVVVGGSCVNSVAADLLGVSSPTCSADFTAKTGVGSGQYLIETFSRTGGKVATLVAGYNAGDTTNAAKALITQAIDTTAGKKYTGTTSTDVSASISA